jgi:site-specific DNA-methyltransferase (adenine-specific)
MRGAPFCGYPNLLKVEEIAARQTPPTLELIQKFFVPVSLYGARQARPAASFSTTSDPRETVLDNCMGSGTTAAACEATGRRWVGIEMDEGFCGIARERLKGLV